MTLEHQATALLALWNDVDPTMEEAYNDWHANEHVPERLTVPGILWARRYAATPLTPGQRYLTLYGLQSAQVLGSAPYQHLLANPTTMSARMRPHLQCISRWVCHIRAKHGGLDGRLLYLFASATELQARRGLCALDSSTSAGSLLAQRIPDVAPLPWMDKTQGKGVTGDWLTVCSSENGLPKPVEGVSTYELRPIRV